MASSRSYQEACALWYSQDRSDVTADNIGEQDQHIRTLWISAGRPPLADQQPRETAAEHASQMEAWLNDRIERHLDAYLDGIGLGVAKYVGERVEELERTFDRRVIGGARAASQSEVLDLPPLGELRREVVDPEIVGRDLAERIGPSLRQYVADQLERLVAELPVSK